MKMNKLCLLAKIFKTGTIFRETELSQLLLNAPFLVSDLWKLEYLFSRKVNNITLQELKSLASMYGVHVKSLVFANTRETTGCLTQYFQLAPIILVLRLVLNKKILIDMLFLPSAERPGSGQSCWCCWDN